MQKIVWLALLGAALLHSCATTIPDLEACAGVSEFAGVGALCQRTNTDAKRRLTVPEWLEFLYAAPERPDPKNPGKMLPAKGPAVCMPSDDYRRNETAIAQLCAKGQCSYEQKKALERMQNFSALVEGASSKHGARK